MKNGLNINKDMNNQDYENKKRECWKEYFKHVVCGTDSHEYWFNKIFDRAYALGKQEKDAEDTVIQGWVARDNDGDLFFYTDKPRRENAVWDEPQYWIGEAYTELNTDLFPDLTWESEPEQVEIIIKRKKNG